MTKARMKMEIDVADAGALHDRAATTMERRGHTPTEILAWIGTRGSPDVGNCLREILQPRDDDAIAVVDTRVVTDAEGPLLDARDWVELSTAHLTERELAEIDEALGLVHGGPDERVPQGIVHRGLRLSPIHAGFIVMVPNGPDAALEALTDDMRRIVGLARGQGIRRLEFHADADEIERLPSHAH